MWRSSPRREVRSVLPCDTVRARIEPVVFAVTLTVGCAHGALPETTVGAKGSTASRPFVSPYSYEHFARGELAFARGDYAEAAEHYREALAADDDPLVLARLAEALAAAGDPAGADDTLSDGFALDPDSEALWLARGAILERRADVDGALAAYARAQDSAADSSAGTLALVRLLSSHGANERAAAVLARIEKRGAGGARVAVERALANADVDALTAAVTQWLRVGPVDVATLQRCARALLDTGRPALGSRLIAGVPEASRDPALALRALVDTARFDEAAALLAREPPDAFGGALVVAEAYLRIGKPAAALEALDALAATTTEDTPNARVLRGEAALALGHWLDAAKLFASVPPASLHRARALAGLAQVLRAQGLDALAAEVAAGTANPTTR